MTDHANCPSRKILRLLLSVPTGGRACGWLRRGHGVCWWIKNLPNFLSVGMELCIRNNSHLEIVHASSQSSSSWLAYVQDEVSENTVTTCNIHQNKRHSPGVQHINMLFINTSQSSFRGPLKLTTCSFQTHTGWEDKTSPLKHLLGRNYPGLPLLWTKFLFYVRQTKNSWDKNQQM